MIPVAVLSPACAALLQHAPLPQLRVVGSATALEELHGVCETKQPELVLCDLGAFTDDAKAEIAALLAHDSIDEVLVVYHFARRDHIESLQRDRVRLIKGPLTVETLRTLLMSRFVNSLFKTGGGDEVKRAQAQQEVPAKALEWRGVIRAHLSALTDLRKKLESELNRNPSAQERIPLSNAIEAVLTLEKAAGGEHVR